MAEGSMATGFLKRSGSHFVRTFQAFRYRDFRLLWAGAFTSTTGTWMQQTAQSWLVLQLTNSPFYLGLTGFLGQIPVVFFSLLGGAFADRVDRRRMLLLSQYVQMASALLLAALVLGGWIRVWHFLALAFVVGTAQAFGGPAYQALIPGLVRREDVPNAIALNSIQFQLARLVGPLLAGVLMASAGAALCFGLNGLSFLAVILSLYLIRSSFIPAPRDRSILFDIGEGFRFLGSQGPLWQLNVLGFVATFCGIPLTTLIPVFARDVFHLESLGYSTMLACSSAGAIAGALFYAGRPRQGKQTVFTLHVQIIFAFCMALFAVSRHLLLSYLALFLCGVCLMSLFASIMSLVQLTTTEEMRGRVMSIFMLAFRGGMPLGDLTAGYLATRVSPTAALLLLSLLMAGVAGLFLWAAQELKEL